MLPLMSFIVRVPNSNCLKLLSSAILAQHWRTRNSPSGLYLATGDASHAITMWERSDSEANEWTDMGRYRPHSQPLVQLLFSDEYGTERLLSLAQDRKLVEYA